MTQDEINEREWGDPANWSGPRWMAFYFSKKDSRTWIPKRIPWMGWTLNLGRDAGVYWLVGFLLGIPLFTIVICAIALAGK